jgi:hypothetical protein
MGNFFSAKILGVDGEIWVFNWQKTRAQSTVQRKKIDSFIYLFSSTNFPKHYTEASTKQLGPTYCALRSKPKTYEKFLLGFPTMKNMAMSTLDFMAIDLVI